MLGSIVVALITVGLLFTGVVVVNNNQNSVDTADTDPYDEGFFSDLNTIADELGKSAERGSEIKEGRYEEFSRVQERSAEATTNFQTAPRVYQPTSPVVVPKTETKPALSTPSSASTTPVAPPKAETKPMIPVPSYIPTTPVTPPEVLDTDDFSDFEEDSFSGFDDFDFDF